MHLIFSPDCVVPIDRGPDNIAPILVLDNLEMVDISRVFGELLDAMEYRGIKHAFYLRGTPASFYH